MFLDGACNAVKCSCCREGLCTHRRESELQLCLLYTFCLDFFSLISQTSRTAISWGMQHPFWWLSGGSTHYCFAMITKCRCLIVSENCVHSSPHSAKLNLRIVPVNTSGFFLPLSFNAEDFLFLDFHVCVQTPQ